MNHYRDFLNHTSNNHTICYFTLYLLDTDNSNRHICFKRFEVMTNFLKSRFQSLPVYEAPEKALRQTTAKPSDPSLP